MTRRKSVYRIRRNAGTRSYMSGVVDFYMTKVKDDGLDLHEARRHLISTMLEAGYVADEAEGLRYARHVVISPATERRDLERARRRAFQGRRPDPAGSPSHEDQHGSR